MGQDFFRRIDGYNYPFALTTNASLARDAILTNTAPAGPGRIELVRCFITDARTTYEPVNNLLIITVDGTVIYSNFIVLLVGTNAGNTTFPRTARTVDAVFNTLEFVVNIDYEASASVGIKNTLSANPSAFYSTIIGRVGR